MGDKTNPNPFFGHFWPLGWFYATWGWLCPFGGGGVISPKGWFTLRLFTGEGGGGYHPFGVVLSPIFGDFIPPLGGGVVTFSGGERLVHLYVN